MILALLVGQKTAHADQVDKLVSQLRKGQSYKVRLAAAVNLSKIGDPRAIPAFIDALKKDSDKNLRGLVAISLGKLVTAGTGKRQKARIIAALEAARKKDADSFVRKQATKALARIKKSGTSSGAAAGGIYIDVGPMSVKAKNAPGMQALMRKTVEKSISKKAASMTTSWPGGKAPSAKQLRSSGTQAFHIDGTLVSLTATPKGSATIVSCKLSMLVATFPKKSMFGFLDGGAKVQASSSPRDIQFAKEDCVAAVVEDLVVKKIIPTIQMRTKSQARASGSKTTTQTRASGSKTTTQTRPRD